MMAKTRELRNGLTRRLHLSLSLSLSPSLPIPYLGEEGKKFFSKILPFVQELILQLPVQFADAKSIPLLRQGYPAKLTLTAHQCAVILACAFFDLLPSGRNCPELAFAGVFSRCEEHSKCLLHYFFRLAVGGISERNVSFHRLVLKNAEEFEPQEDTKLTEFKVLPVGHMIEDADGCLQADFANEWIGGGVLQAGCVQEEILFLEKPECLCSMLFCEVMLANESITLVGAERFSKHTGYARGFKYAGDFKDKTPLDPKRRISNVIIAFDAIVAFSVLVKGKMKDERITFLTKNLDWWRVRQWMSLYTCNLCKNHLSAIMDADSVP